MSKIKGHNIFSEVFEFQILVVFLDLFDLFYNNIPWNKSVKPVLHFLTQMSWRLKDNFKTSNGYKKKVSKFKMFYQGP